jgi:hypothetical protein
LFGGKNKYMPQSWLKALKLYAGKILKKEVIGEV